MDRSTPPDRGPRRGVRVWTLAALAAVLVAAPLTPRPAHASSALALQLDDLARRSSLIVRARVAALTASWDPSHRRISTRVELQVLERLGGEAPSVVVVVQPGGELDGLVQRVDGAPSWTLGEEVVVFLSATAGGEPRVVGLSQGKWRVLRDSVVPEPSGELMLVDPHTRRVVPSPLAPTTLPALRRALAAASAAARRTP